VWGEEDNEMIEELKVDLRSPALGEHVIDAFRYVIFNFGADIRWKVGAMESSIHILRCAINPVNVSREKRVHVSLLPFRCIQQRKFIFGHSEIKELEFRKSAITLRDIVPELQYKEIAIFFHVYELIGFMAGYEKTWEERQKVYVDFVEKFLEVFMGSLNNIRIARH
jgi:hypothetical protein